MRRTFALALMANLALAGCGGDNSTGADNEANPADDETMPQAVIVEVEPEPTTSDDATPTETAPGSQPVALPELQTEPGPTPAPGSETGPDPVVESELTPEPEPPTGPESSPEPTSGSEVPDEPVATPDPEPAQQAEPAPVPGTDLIGDADIENFPGRAGIAVDIVRFGYDAFGQPEVELRLENGSRRTIYNANCAIAALAGNRILDTARTFFASLDPIDPGESALDAGAWFELDGGFSSADRFRITCDWLNGDGGRIDLASDPVSVDFVGYTSEFGHPAVILLMTNNSARTIYNASCGVEAKRGDVIVDVASLFFADLGDIRTGEAAETASPWLELSSLDEFDAEPFDPANLNCSYLVRR